MSEIEEGVGEWFDPAPLKQLYINKNLMEHNISRLEDEVSALKDKALNLEYERDYYKGLTADLKTKKARLEEAYSKTHEELLTMCHASIEQDEAMAHATDMLRAEKQAHVNTIRFFSKMMLDIIEGD